MQEELYRRFSPRMYGVCLRYAGTAAEAEDILQEGFIKVYKKLSSYRREGSFEGWIRRVMVNEALTYLRRSKNMYLETDIEAADREPDYHRLENQLEAEDLMKLIADLPAGYRIVFNLYAIDGYSHQEIADQLGITESTSKSQLSRARSWLQRALLDLEVGMKKEKKM